MIATLVQILLILNISCRVRTRAQFIGNFKDKVDALRTLVRSSTGSDAWDVWALCGSNNYNEIIVDAGITIYQCDYSKVISTWREIEFVNVIFTLNETSGPIIMGYYFVETNQLNMSNVLNVNWGPNLPPYWDLNVYSFEHAYQVIIFYMIYTYTFIDCTIHLYRYMQLNLVIRYLEDLSMQKHLYHVLLNQAGIY